MPRNYRIDLKNIEAEQTIGRFSRGIIDDRIGQDLSRSVNSGLSESRDAGLCIRQISGRDQRDHIRLWKSRTRTNSGIQLLGIVERAGKIHKDLIARDLGFGLQINDRLDLRIRRKLKHTALNYVTILSEKYRSAIGGDPTGDLRVFGCAGEPQRYRSRKIRNIVPNDQRIAAFDRQVETGSTNG